MSNWEPPTGPIPVQQPFPPTQRGGGGRTAWVVALLAVAALLVVTGFWLRSEAADRTAEAESVNSTATSVENEAKALAEGGDNEVLSDPELTREVTDYLSKAVEETFSYNYTDLSATDQAVEQHLTGDARCVYDKLFGEVKRLAPEQKIVLESTVREVALVSLNGDDAKGLIFIDQRSTRGDTNISVSVSSQFGVKTHRDGDRWKITELDMFGQSLSTGEQVPTC